MSQVPLAPPPPTGGPLDGWLYLLWRRLTQAGQILWGTITPGTSADVAAVVTDETGTAGSLVFSGNPTLQGAVIDGSLGVGSAAVTKLSVYDATAAVFFLHGDGAVGQTLQRSSNDATAPSFTMKKTRGTYASPTAVASGDLLFTLAGNAYGGTTTGTLAFIAMNVETYTADTNMSGYMRFLTRPDGVGAAAVENVRIAGNGTVTLGGLSTTPALKVTPVASQARWIEVTGATSSANPQLATTAGELLLPQNIVLPKTSGKGIQVDTAAPTFGWRDMLGPIGVKTAGATDPVWKLYRGSMYAYTFDSTTAEAFFTFHVPHDYVPASDMLIHMHWSQIVVDTGGTAGVPGNVEWNFDITYADGHGTAGGAADPFAAPKTVTVVQQASTTQYGHMIAEVQFTSNGGSATTIDRNTIVVDGLILVRAYRIKGNAADTLNQAPFGHTCDIHYQSTNIGTKQNNPITTGSFYT